MRLIVLVECRAETAYRTDFIKSAIEHRANVIHISMNGSVPRFAIIQQFIGTTQKLEL